MNYLTAIIALPLFLAITLFEFYLYFRGRPRSGSKGTVRACMVISVLQMVSCFFWFFGFVFSKTDNVLSEAMEEDEEMDCFGLVGAEVLLSIFQWIFTLLTLYQYLVARRLASARDGMKKVSAGLDKTGGAIMKISAVILGIYTVLAWSTAYNRRCPQGKDYLPWFYHHFYPVYLLIDSAISLATQVPVNQVAKKVLENSKDNSRVERSMMNLVTFYRSQCYLTIAAGVFAFGIFVIQFMLKIKALSVVACMFCVTMYCLYALRRVRILAMNMNFVLTKLHFGAGTTTGVSGESVSALKRYNVSASGAGGRGRGKPPPVLANHQVFVSPGGDA